MDKKKKEENKKNCSKCAQACPCANKSKKDIIHCQECMIPPDECKCYK